MEYYNVSLRFKNAKDEQVSIYASHGADPILANAMTLWNISSYSPSGTLTERIKSASDAYDFLYISFAMFLLHKTKMAVAYLQRAIELDTKGVVIDEKAKIILSNPRKVQKVLNASRGDLDNFRLKYRLSSLEAILLKE